MGHIGYRPPATPPTTRWARFLHEQHRKRDWNATEGFEKLRVGLRLRPKSRTSYTDGLLTGKREPNDLEQQFLIEYFGEGPGEEPEPEPQPVADLSTLVATMQELIEELRLARTERDTAQQVMMKALAAALAPQGTRTEDEPGTPERSPAASEHRPVETSR